MRHVLWTTLLLLLAGSSASAQIGPPQSRARQHGYSLGVGLHNVQSRWMPYDYDMARNRIYFEGSYGFTHGMEAFGRVGVSDWAINDIESYQAGMKRDVSSDGYPAFVSGGLRGQVWRHGRLSLGGSLEVARYSAQERDIRWNFDAYQELYFDPTLEVTAALTAGCQLGRGVVYGGPLLHFGYTRVDVRTHKFGPGWDVEDSVNALTIRDKGGAGGFLGWRTPIGQNGWRLQLEGVGLDGGLGGSLGVFKSW